MSLDAGDPNFSRDDTRLSDMHGYVPMWMPALLEHITLMTNAVEHVRNQTERIETLIRELRAQLITRGSL